MEYEEKLPFPYVCYPCFNGAFIGFKKDLDTEFHLCACNRKAVKNLIGIKLMEEKELMPGILNPKILSGQIFPLEVLSQLLKKQIESNAEIINKIQFKEKICHLCNLIPPLNAKLNSRNIGEQFHTYNNMLQLTHGLLSTRKIFKRFCSKDILKLIDVDPQKNWQEVRRLNPNSEELMDLSKEMRGKIDILMDPVFRQDQRIRKYIENQIRNKFGLKNIEDFWEKETKLFNIIKELFHNEKVERHHRPCFMKGLEFDIYIQKVRLAVEYQGQQHYKSFKFWGGNKAFIELKKRDKKKKRLSKLNGIDLICIKYTEMLTKENIEEKLEKYLKGK